MNNKFNLNMHDYIEQPEGKLFFNRQLFSHIASKYDLINRVLSFNRDIAWKKRLVDDLPDVARASSPCLHGQDGRATGPVCLDIACGTGDITFRLAAKYPDGKITGIDVTEEMLNLARSRLRSSSIGCATRFGCVSRLSSCNTQPYDDGRYELRNRNRFAQPFENITFVLQDMCKIGHPDNSFDIVTGGYALRNAPDLEMALKEIRRIMKPGATAAFLDFSKPSNCTLQKIEVTLLKIWCCLWSTLLHGSPRLYAYLPESIKYFPDSAALKQLITKLGFTNIRSRKHFLGFTETIIFQKGPAPF